MDKLAHNQNGTAPLLAIIAVVGVAAFLVVATVAPFRSKTLTTLYPKENSHASAALPSDLNNDGSVNAVDFALLLAKWGTTDPEADLNDDGIVGLVDFSILLSKWGQTAPTPSPSTPTTGANSVILDRYDFDWTQLQRGIQSEAAYYPRKVANGLAVADGRCQTTTITNAGSYSGWDLLRTPNMHDWPEVDMAQYVKLTVQRQSTVALVWRSKTNPPPTWLSQQGWVESGTLGISTVSGCGTTANYKVFKKTVPAGSFWLPSPKHQTLGAQSWWVLFAEADGKASTAPTVPSGKEVPVANDTCPTWVHDQYVTTGPDGKSYATWHRAIDPTYWCYLRHEHGTDPALLGVSGFKPTFHYAAHHDNATEFHQGFKVLVWDDRDSPYTHMDIMHFGTGNTNSVCNRFHEIQHAGAKNGELLYYVQFQADFGEPRANNLPDTSTNLMTHPNCPGGQLAAGSTGRRFMPHQDSINGSSGDPIFYEPWRTDVRATRSALGVYMFDFHINNPDAMTICKDKSCSQTIVTGKPGAQRFMSIQPAAEVKAPVHVNSQGYFWTDAKATQVLSEGASGAIRQFVKPGLLLPVTELFNTEAITTTAIWGAQKDQIISGSSHGAVRNPELSIRIPN